MCGLVDGRGVGLCCGKCCAERELGCLGCLCLLVLCLSWKGWMKN